MSTAVTLFVQNGFSVAPTAEATAVRDAVLARSALVGKVATPEDNERANECLREVKTLLKQVESARKAVKEPFLEACRKIDGTAKAFTEELLDEDNRLARAMSDYASILFERAREEERKRQSELARIAADTLAEQRKLDEARLKAEAEARAKAAAEAAAARNEAERIAAEARAKAEAERIAKEAEAAAKRSQELAQQEMEAVKVVAPPPKPEGQTVRAEWEFEITDIYALSRTHPGLVKIEPRRAEIKEVIARLAECGEPKLPGVRIWKETKVGARVGKQQVIEV